MSQISVEKNIKGISGLCLITPHVYSDSRGYFTETYNLRDLAEYGLDYLFVQDNQSMSRKGVLRGLHYQKRHPQSKLVRVIKGCVFDVAVDLRIGSDTFGQWHGEILSEENHKQLLIPRGFAHGFFVLSDFAEFCYKCDEYYYPSDEGGIAWNDPDIGILWPNILGAYSGNASAEGYSYDDKPLILSEKDQSWQCLNKSNLFL